ncbi:hypothetical protein AKO1_005991 [Acrasis kona]|uniref:Transmembrane protein 135 N-terminal domain-containing protein n=1 Tax=Acrasis kona TaxID=1008807 RepID=A0AAW2YII3_9EUKA
MMKHPSKKRSMFDLLFGQPSFKTGLCQHEHSCPRNAITGAVRGFVIGYIVRSGLSIVFSIAFGRMFKKREESSKCENQGLEQVPKKFHTPGQLLKEYLTGSDTIRFALFLCSFTGVYKSVLCLMRYLRQKDDDGWNYFIAGSLAGSTMLVDKRSRWSEISIYLFAQACATVARSLVHNKKILSNERSLITRLLKNHTDTILFSSFGSIIMLVFIYCPELFPSSYMKLFETIEGEDSTVAHRYRIKFRRYWNSFGFKTSK